MPRAHAKMPSVLVELISGDMVESYRREAALDRKRGRGWSPAHTTPKSAGSNCDMAAQKGYVCSTPGTGSDGDQTGVSDISFQTREPRIQPR
jgi:hypothetical protein